MESVIDKHVETIDFDGLPVDALNSLLKRHKINLSLDEGRQIQNKILGRPPTVAECVLWSIEGSEHCSYKSSKVHLKSLPTKASNVLLPIGEDAGVVCVAKSKDGTPYGIAISHESHNHPSQIVPFEGAATGVGGNVRDVSCMGAEVVALADCLRFGPLDNYKTRWLSQGVVDGIASYGNALGIPNIAGNAYYGPSYQDNCLVTVVSLGIVRGDRILHSYVPKSAKGYVLVLVGKATDNSGFGGASFASNNLDEETANRGAVQEPNAFLERHLLKANTALFKHFADEGVLSELAFKDLGAGGIACASVELADGGGFGCRVNLDNVHVGMAGLDPSVILCAETQERFMWAVPKALVDTVLTFYNQTFALPDVSFGAKAVAIGEITDDGKYVVTKDGKVIVDAKASDVTAGLTVEREMIKPKPTFTRMTKTCADYNEALLELLALPDIACQKAVYEHYDKQVQRRTVIERGKAKAGLIQPFNSADYPLEIRKTGVALSVYQNPRVNALDSYFGAKHAVIRAMEQVASLGASPEAITDCLCYGSPENPHHMWDFAAAVDAISETLAEYHLIDYPSECIPVVAGNVSFYNATGDRSIVPSPMISCLGKMANVDNACDNAFKQNDSIICMLTDDELNLSGSAYYAIHDATGESLPNIDMALVEQRIHFIVEAVNQGLLLATNTIDSGGLAAALAEMSIKGQRGASIKLDDSEPLEKSLFAESGGFVVEVARARFDALSMLADKRLVTLKMIGETTYNPRLVINQAIEAPIQTLTKVWRESFRRLLQ